MKIKLLILICLLGVGVGICGPVDRTLDILEEGIAELGRQPARWENTMVSIIEQLDQSGTDLSRNVLVEVRSIYNGILGQTTGEFSCRSDFIANRLQQRLQAIGHKFASNRFPSPQILPVVCSTNPGDRITPEVNVVVYYGYDFLEFEQTGTFQAVLQYADKAEIYSQAGYVSRTHNYQLVVDLQSPKLKEVMQRMDRNRGPQIVLRWGDQLVTNDLGKQSALPIILPTLPKSFTITLNYGNSFQVKGGGRGGGNQMQIVCPSKYVATGIAVRAGERIDQIRLQCSQLNLNGTTGQSFLTDPKGGWGGTDFLLSCPPNQMLTQIKGRAGNRVDQLQGYCTSADGSSFFETGIAGGGGGSAFDGSKCPANYVITGITGRSAQEIDQINIICTEIVRQMSH